MKTDVLFKPAVSGFFDRRTWSVQYVVSDARTRECAIIDPVLDFDDKSGSTSTASADQILTWIEAWDLKPTWILDTHPHADHFSAAHYLKGKTGARIAIGHRVTEMQSLWSKLYGKSDVGVDISHWDHMFSPGERFKVGAIEGCVMASPGHTLASVTYLIGDAAFIHDTLFMPDSGTARADFPGGSAAELWESIQNILMLPDDTRLFTGHDYQPGGRLPAWESTVGEQRAKNIHLRLGVQKPDYIELRETRDRTLPMPKLMLSALQVNLRGGRLPEPEESGGRFLKIPLGAFPDAVWG